LCYRSLSAIADAQSALQRLKSVFHAELMQGTTFDVDHDLDVALRVERASFQWESEGPQAESNDNAQSTKSTSKSKSKAASEKGEVHFDEKRQQQQFGGVPPGPQAPFAIRELDVVIPRGQLCAIVGPVGSGKSSLLLGACAFILLRGLRLRCGGTGLIGEMRRTSGSCVFGGSVAYCAQSAWIQNATLVRGFPARVVSFSLMWGFFLAG
jgi:ATP-binding cassette subfamily C (CFTR/MRP) protein 1